MQVLELGGVSIGGLCACVPAQSEDNLERCTALYGDAEKARAVVQATGIASRRVAAPGESSLDLCVRAAEALFAGTDVARSEVGSVVAVTFTPERAMPCNACRAQARLGLSGDIVAFDVGLACSGWAYGLWTAGTLARATGRPALLLDGDVQTPHVAPDDGAVVPVLADAGTATLVLPSAPAGAAPWRFAFLTDGAQGAALTCPSGGRIAMDGMAVFRFVTVDVLRFLRDFLAQTGATAETVDAFVPHQANVYMIRQLAKRLGLGGKLAVSGDTLGNSASATVPVTIAHAGARGRLLVSGFGGGLSASAALVDVASGCFLKRV